MRDVCYEKIKPFYLMPEWESLNVIIIFFFFHFVLN